MAMNSLAGKAFGRYYLLEQIGLGGMATVYKGLDLDRDQKVAIKVLSPHLAHNPALLTRFEREVKLLRNLQHPHIVPIIDFGEVDGYPYIVMPFFPGGTLQDRFRQGPLTLGEGARVMEQLSAGLQFAHTRGVIHRDVKPSNVLLDGQGNAFLSDFGFAHIQDASLSLTGSALIGTPAYMSPEQCRGDSIDQRSDQYSLGVILHQIATSRLPFEADTPMGLVIKHANVPLTPPRQLSPNIPEAVEAVIIKSLAKDPARRFASVEELNYAFQKALSDSVDASGMLKYKPRPVPKPKPVPAPVLAEEASTKSLQQRRGRRRLPLAVAGLLLLACLPIAWVVVAQSDGITSAGGAATSTPQDLMATINALSTQVAGEAPAGLSPEEVAAIVAATLAGSSPSGGDTGPATLSPELSATPGMVATATYRAASRTAAAGPPVGTSPSGATWTPTPTPTITLTHTAGPSPTPTGTPTPGPSPTPTDVPSPTATEPPTSTATLPPTPTRTPVPPPTDTRTPVTPPTIDPASCHWNPSSAKYCTPTPTP